jgi:hypothetical protein
VDHEESRQPLLPGVPAGGVPAQALAYRAAVLRVRAAGVTRRLTDADLAAELGISQRTWVRRKQELRNGKLGRDWLETWPPPMDWRPSWEPLIGPPVQAKPEDDGLTHLVYDEVYDRTGKLVERRLLRHLGHLLGTAAAIMPYTIAGCNALRQAGSQQQIHRLILLTLHLASHLKLT